MSFNYKSETSNIKSLAMETVWSMESKAIDKSLKKSSKCVTFIYWSLNFSVITKILCWELYPLRKEVSKNLFAKKKKLQFNNWNKNK